MNWIFAFLTKPVVLCGMILQSHAFQFYWSYITHYTYIAIDSILPVNLMITCIRRTFYSSTCLKMEKWTCSVCWRRVVMKESQTSLITQHDLTDQTQSHSHMHWSEIHVSSESTMPSFGCFRLCSECYQMQPYVLYGKRSWEELMRLGFVRHSDFVLNDGREDGWSSKHEWMTESRWSHLRTDRQEDKRGRGRAREIARGRRESEERVTVRHYPMKLLHAIRTGERKKESREWAWKETITQRCTIRTAVLTRLHRNNTQRDRKCERPQFSTE